MADNPVILCGMLGPYQNPANGVEVWAVNRAFKHLRDPNDPDSGYELQEGLARIYAMHPPYHFPAYFVSEVNETGVPFVSLDRYDEIPLSQAYPLDRVVQYFNGLRYFNCTASYMLAQAIMEGRNPIYLHGMYHWLDSLEYMPAKSCMDMWCGIAMGMGRGLIIEDESALTRPFKWEPPCYGYEIELNAPLFGKTLAAAYVACLQYPTIRRPYEEFRAGPKGGIVHEPTRQQAQQT